jgi:thiol-disulfide isomerase/thioredoxin
MKSAPKKLLAALVCCAALATAQPPKRAPGFCLADTTGQWRDLYDYHGKVVLIEFMQTTCPHCEDFAAVLDALSKKYAGKLQIISVALPTAPPTSMQDYAALQKSLLAFVATHKLTYPLLLDMGQVAASYVRTPNLAFPHIYLVDGAGMIKGNWEYNPMAKDMFETKALAAEIDRILGPAPAKK